MDNAKQQAEAQLQIIINLVIALNVDYDRLEELLAEKTNWLEENPASFIEPNDPRNGAGWSLACPDESDELSELSALSNASGHCYKSREEVEEAIQEYPLDIQVRSDWHDPGDTSEPAEFSILLCTGGPAVRIRGELDASSHRDRYPRRAYIEYQDWGTPWTELIFSVGENQGESVLEFCRQFYFGE